MTEKETGNAQPGACVDVLPRCWSLHSLGGTKEGARPQPTLKSENVSVDEKTIRKKSGRKRYKRSVHLNKYEYPNINTILTLMRPVHCATSILNALDILSVLPT